MSVLKKPLVCHLLLGASNQVAGIQRYIASLADNYTMLIINKAPKYEKYLRQNKTRHYVYDDNFNELQKIIIKNNINIVHAHLGKAALLARKLKKTMPQLKLVYTQHFINPAYTNSKIYLIKRIIYKKIFNDFDKIIAISGAVQKAILNRGETPAQKIRLVYSGIDFPAINLRLKPPQKKVITICRLERDKRPFLILALAALLPEYEFIVAGDGSLLPELRRQAPANIQFMGYQKNIFKLLQENSFFFLPTQEEGFGLVFVEALFIGLPVIAFNSGAAPEIIGKKEGCLLNSEEELYKAKAFIENLQQDKKKYAKYSRQARLKASRFSLKEMKKNIELVYRDILK